MSCQCGGATGKKEYYAGDTYGFSICLDCWRNPESNLHTKIIPEIGIDNYLADVRVDLFYDFEYDLVDQYKVLDRMQSDRTEVFKEATKPPQDEESIERIIGQCEFKDWDLLVKYEDRPYESPRPYLQVHFKGADSITGEVEDQWCRKWFLSYHMCDSEIVRTAHMAVKQAAMHEVDEMFKFNGRTIYNPHRDVYALWEISNKDNVDVRS